MARIPEPAPQPRIAPHAFEELLDRDRGNGLASLLDKANTQYLYWDKFKHQGLPEGITAEEAWSVLKVVRKLRRRYTPVRDVHRHDFWYAETEEVQRCLHVIDQRAGTHLTSATDGIPADAQQRYLISGLMEEAIASSQIEGAATTRRVAKEMLRTGRRPVDTSERMILNNYLAIQRIRDLKDEEITPDILRQLQATLTADTLARPSDVGAFRTTNDILVIDRDEILHTPPDASEVPAELERLCAFANNDQGPFRHPVLKAIVLHFWLAYLHPFPDGNGRTARALFYLYMLKHDYWLFEYVSISKAIKKRRTDYEKSFLYSEVDEADCTYFLTYNLHMIETAIADLHSYLEDKSHEDEALRSKLQRDFRLNHRQRAVLLRALKDPETLFTIESHQRSHGVAYATARGDLLELADKGYLKQLRQGRQFVFRASRDLRERLARRH